MFSETQKENLVYRTLLALALILLAAALRIAPHPWNFTPVGAMALFSGALLKNRRLAFFFPLLALFLGDIFIGFHKLIPIVYASFLINVAIGHSAPFSFSSPPTSPSGKSSAAFPILFLASSLATPPAFPFSGTRLQATPLTPFFSSAAMPWQNASFLRCASLYGLQADAIIFVPLWRNPLQRPLQSRPTCSRNTNPSSASKSTSSSSHAQKSSAGALPASATRQTPTSARCVSAYRGLFLF
jgi:hypothetical protein